MTTLLALHGYTHNAALMREQLGEMGNQLAAHVDLLCIDAPGICPPESVESIYGFWKQPIPVPPHRQWWNASSDGSDYAGWTETREVFRELLSAHPGAGLLGFSQGAILTTALCALSVAGELPPVGFAVLIGGGAPRADALAPYLSQPIQIPSFHLWGERDFMRGPASELVERFTDEGRRVERWPGPHKIPSEGKAVDALVDFVSQHVGSRT